MQLKIKEEDLVLQISSSYNPNNFNINKYEAFIDKLCWTREYQKQAIKQACIYLLWWRYKNLLDLARENYDNSDILKEKHKTFSNFEDKINLKDKLSCNIDLATWTWKSYVIYWIAQIMLCEWKIDRVLVLAPSVTIEDWLTSKFKSLSSDRDLKELLPKDSAFKNPTIIQATKTIEEWNICVENIHSTYKNTSSAIKDSVLWVWEKTLILNDEAHHIYSKVNADVKKWYEFLADKDFNFKYIVWFTWTPYIDSDYFTDIIYRYSILEWMDDKFIKTVNYIKDSDKVFDSLWRMQLILENHREAIKIYNKIKPITILISKDIKHCDKDKTELIDFLHKEEWISKEELEKKVLIVTSDKKHKDNLDILKTVWDKNNPVEWICSVAMLTEWWDVPNVFQIVPSEEKAFNSKLLISQVIWRWLRVPVEYKWEDLTVTVLNHKKFKDNISHLVDEILEKEDKIYSYPIESKKDYSFPIYNLEYDEDQIEEAKTTEYKAPNFKDWFNLFSDDEEEEVNITYWTMWSDNEIEKQITIKKETKTIDELSLEIENKIRSWCIELESEWAKEEEIEKLEELNFENIKNIIQKSLDKKWLDNQKISKENSVKILWWFWVMKRFWTKNIRYNKEAKDIVELDIYKESSWLWKSWVSISTVKKWKSYIFYDESSIKYSEDEDKKWLEILNAFETLRSLEESWNDAWKKYTIKIENSHLNKTPLNLNIASSTPEKQFIEYLVDEKYFKIIDAFFKSKDRGFYDLEYRWIHWTRTPKVWKFNPDFFIKSWNKILVIEIKWTESEKEYSRSFIQNKAKYLQAKKHFDDLNKKLEEKWIDQKYYFSFCSPKDYRTLFKYLEKWNIDKFTSRLESSFEESLLKDSNIKQLEFFDDKELKRVFWDYWNKLEDDSKVFLTTAEKNYFDNKDNNTYNFSWWELVKAFELELRNKIFDRIRDDEEVSYEIMEEEEKNPKNNLKYKTLDYFNYQTELLDLWTMQTLLTYNKSLIKHIKEKFGNFNFDLWINWDNRNLIKWKQFDLLWDEIYTDLPNLISLIRERFRNADSHGAKVIKKEELEELRDIMLYWKWILVKITEIN